VQRFRLLLKKRADYFGRPLTSLEHFAAGQVERGVLGVIAGDGAQSVFAQAVDQAANPEMPLAAPAE
jgi:hypothetical protein